MFLDGPSVRRACEEQGKKAIKPHYFASHQVPPPRSNVCSSAFDICIYLKEKNKEFQLAALSCLCLFV